MDVKIKVPSELVEKKMAILMENGNEIANKLTKLTELEPEDPKEILEAFSEGMEMLTELKTICEDLTTLDELRSLAELFGE